MSIQTLVKGKVNSMRERVRSAGEDSEQVSIVHNDYSLYFQGASEALEASGAEADQIKPINLAISMIEADMAALASKTALDAALA